MSLAAGMLPTPGGAAENSFQQFDLELPVGAGKVCADGLEALELRRYADAEASFRKTLSLLKQHSDPHPFETAMVSNWLGHALVEQRHYVEGETVLRRALAGVQAEAKRPSATTARAGLSHVEASVMVELGLALYGQHRYAEAELFFARALQQLERLPNSDETGVEKACYFLGSSLTKLGRPSEGERCLRQALEHCEKGPPGQCDNLPVNLWGLGVALAAQRKFDEAERFLRQSVTLFHQKKKSDKNNATELEVAAVLGQVLLEQGRAKEAQPFLEGAVTFLSRKGFEKDILTQNAARDLDRCLRAQGRDAEAEELQRRHGIGPTTDLANDGMQPDVLRSLAIKIQDERLLKAVPAKIMDEALPGFDALNQRQFPQAEKIFRSVLQKVQRSSRIPPHMVAQFQVHLGVALTEQLRYAKAEPYLRSALEAQEALVQKQGKKTDLADLVYLCRTKLRLGLALHGQKRFPEAIEIFVQGLNLADAIGLDDSAIATSRLYLGDDFFCLKKYIQAEDQYRRAVETCKMYHVSEDQHLYLSSLIGVARSVFERERYADAIPLLERTIPLAERSKHLRPHSEVTVSLAWRLGISLHHAQRPAEAESIFRRGLPKVETQFGPQSTEAASFHEGLGLSLEGLKRPEEAEVHLRQAAQIRGAIAPDDEDTAETFILHAEMLESLGKPQDAVRVYHQAVGILERPGIKAPETLDRALQGLGKALRDAGRDAEAEMIDQKRRRLDHGDPPTPE